jgi:bifunctional N-acetylglucosamine-1-phosphate-uridyltransferase/glucosamine-1-phosphate-acetyltransferase GlmU-like protein
LWRELARIGNNNASGEYYLTDVVGLLNQAGEHVVAVDVTEREMTGINTRAQLNALQDELIAEGVC